MKDPYKVLGLSKDSAKEELTARYNELKAKFSEDRFISGEEGNIAARNLSELESAWRLISDDINKSEQKKNFGGDYGSIDNMIKEGRFDDAQSALDSISNRVGEWHYLQSIVYYKREWLTESRLQLQMAVNMEPWNDKYKTALDKLNIVMGNPNTDPRTIGVDPNMQRTGQSETGQVCGNSCSNCCMAYCMADCCCSLMRCCG